MVDYLMLVSVHWWLRLQGALLANISDAKSIGVKMAASIESLITTKILIFLY